jgi:hypothetical protein
MKSILRSCLAVSFLLSCLAQRGPAQDVPKEVKAKIDAAIEGAYQSASAAFPCKLKSRGKPSMLHWELVDRCLNDASTRVDWDSLSMELENLRKGMAQSDFAAAVDASLSEHAVPYEKVFSVKDDGALLPLTNSILKYLSPNGLQNVAVFDKTGKKLGTFSGVYAYERTGGLATANTYRLTLFQYTDSTGNIQSATDRLLLDSFGVPWKEAGSSGSFRLNSEKLPH